MLDESLDNAYSAIDNIVYDIAENVAYNMRVLKNSIKELESIKAYSYKKDVIDEISYVLCNIKDLNSGSLELAFYHLELLEKSND